MVEVLEFISEKIGLIMGAILGIIVITTVGVAIVERLITEGHW